MRVCGVQEGEEEEGESGDEGAAPGGSDAEDGTKYVPLPFLYYVLNVYMYCRLCISFSFDNLLSVRVCCFLTISVCALIGVFRRRLKRIRRDAAVVEEVRHDRNRTTHKRYRFHALVIVSFRAIQDINPRTPTQFPYLSQPPSPLSGVVCVIRCAMSWRTCRTTACVTWARTSCPWDGRRRKRRRSSDAPSTCGGLIHEGEREGGKGEKGKVE